MITTATGTMMPIAIWAGCVRPPCEGAAEAVEVTPGGEGRSVIAGVVTTVVECAVGDGALDVRVVDIVVVLLDPVDDGKGVVVV